jgi:hypothetical protein
MTLGAGSGSTPNEATNSLQSGPDSKNSMSLTTSKFRALFNFMPGGSGKENSR